MDFKEFRGWLLENEKELFIIGLVVALGIFVYAFVRIGVLESEKTPIRIEKGIFLGGVKGEGAQGEATLSQEESGLLVGSVKGSKYHFPWCPGAKQISEQNKIWFMSKEGVGTTFTFTLKSDLV